MTSTKKYEKIECIKCQVILDSNNWANYDKNKKYYICNNCRKENDKKHHQTKDYLKKQRGNYRIKRSAVILAYGNMCNTCNEDDYTKLTINGKW